MKDVAKTRTLAYTTFWAYHQQLAALADRIAQI